MKSAFNIALRKDLFSFVKKAFREDQGQKLGQQPYIEYMCCELSKIRTGQDRFFLINLPPQHLKTFCTTCLIAWYLGQKPKHRVLVIGYTGDHAETISRRVRNIMRSDWYKAAFRARVSPSRSSAGAFETTDGGGLYAVSANGSVTGRPADLIVYDDPVQINDCDNVELLEKVNRQFDSLIMSRLSNPAEGCVVIVAHRLNENDLSGHVLNQGEFRHICLPAIAPRTQRFDIGDRTWVRHKGEPLRPDQYPPKVIARLRKSVVVPDFETLYQQNPGGDSSVKLKGEEFRLRDLPRMPERPIVLSVDPGGWSLRPGQSYSVIQLWMPLADGSHLLWDQFRKQCGLDELWAALKDLARRTPAAILIESTANGPALIERAKRKPRYNVVPVKPDRRSKTERLQRHIRTIRDGHIHLRQGASWLDEFLTELVGFPSAPFNDQVDALSQYLDYVAQNPPLTIPTSAGMCAMAARWGTSSGVQSAPDMQAPGIVAHMGSSRRNVW
jgi:predicted phage terminase large subunit-like protein